MLAIHFILLSHRSNEIPICLRYFEMDLINLYLKNPNTETPKLQVFKGNTWGIVSRLDGI